MRLFRRTRRPVDADSAVRRSFQDVRGATPSGAVWDRIAADLGPAGGAGLAERWRLSLPMATLAGVMCVVVLALGGLNAELSTGLRAPVLDNAPAVSGREPGMFSTELAIQPAVSPRAVDLTLPPPADGGDVDAHAASAFGWHGPQERLNRDAWPIAESAPTHAVGSADTLLQ
jgi:hypothetical protein